MRILAGFGIVVLALAVALALSWRGLATETLTRELGKRGIVVSSFEIGGLSLDGMEFRNVTLRQPVALTLPHLALGFSREALRQRQWGAAVSSVTIDSVALALEQVEGEWRLNGQPLPKGGEASQADASTFLAPLAMFPGIEIKQGLLRIKTPDLALILPLSFLSKTENGAIGLYLKATAPLLQASGWTIQAKDMALTLQSAAGGTGLIKLSLALQEPLAKQGVLTAKAQQAAMNVSMDAAMAPAGGNITIERFAVRKDKLSADIPRLPVSLAWPAKAPFPLRIASEIATMRLEGVPPEFAVLAAALSCDLAQERFDCRNVKVQTPKAAYRLQGSAKGPYTTPDAWQWQANLKAENVLGGKVQASARPVGKGLSPARIQLKAEHLQLQQVLSLLAEGKATAEGTVSGAVPLVWHGGQDVTVGQGELTSDAPGVLHLSPELLRMDNPQVAMVSGVLADFRYSHLGIALEGLGRNRLKARLSLEGNNPTQWNGRAVKLNVNLGGDLLSLLKQSILPMSDPRQWFDNPPPSSH